MGSKFGNLSYLVLHLLLKGGLFLLPGLAATVSRETKLVAYRGCCLWLWGVV